MTVIRILSDIFVMLIYWTWSTGSCHCPDNDRSGLASSFTGWGGCHSCRPHGDWTTPVLCCIISTDINIYIHLQTESFKYTHLKILLGNEGCDNLSLHRHCSTWMDVISYWCQTKTKKPTMAVTKKTKFLNVMSLHSRRWLLQSMHQERG